MMDGLETVHVVYLAPLEVRAKQCPLPSTWKIARASDSVMSLPHGSRIMNSRLIY